MTNSGDVPPYADSEIIMKPTDDLIDRLRFHTATLDRSLCIEAADRIEALEAALRNILSWRSFRLCHKIARAALDGVPTSLDGVPI